MRGPLMTSYPDYLTQLARLLADPVYRGQGVAQGEGAPGVTDSWISRGRLELAAHGGVA